MGKYEQDSAAWLLAQLEPADTVADGADTRGPGWAEHVSYSSARAACERDAMGSDSYEHRRRVAVSYPAWYTDALRAGLDGAALRDALSCVATGAVPRKRREDRWVADALASAACEGDATLRLPARDGRDDGEGGAKRGVTQARHTRGLGPVERVPLRAPEALLEALRAEAARRGVTLNALCVAVLTDAALRFGPET